MAKSRKYIRTEPPALLTEPLTFTLDGYALQQLNVYRQARYAYLSSLEGVEPEEGGRLIMARRQAAEALAGYLAMNVQHQLGEPSDFGPIDVV
ncbi:hypothetical protein G7009_18070 [Pseudomonas capeferrum]|uniref:hypothetical protein n=1 Tax=Pseudomonas TaxID=286 RepID=UPI0015E41162|nr:MULTISPECIES: hypothetical protein [Pseudomonas]MBA1203631.1 hypothetical protein [Pseudomonas capeferrum]